MTASDRFAEDTAGLAQAATRLDALERKHQDLALTFEQLRRQVLGRHHAGCDAAVEMDELARLERLIARGEAETLAIVESVMPLVRSQGDNG